MIRYHANPDKILEALVWLADAKRGLSFYYIAKIFYFADKEHLSRFGRPVLGDRYIAMDHGPVPSMIYDMLMFNPFLDPTLLDSLYKAIQVTHERVPTVSALRPADMSLLSRTDIDALRASLNKYGNKSVGDLRRVTHAERAYRQASPNAEMDYALILEEDLPEREKKIRHIEAVSETLAL